MMTRRYAGKEDPGNVIRSRLRRAKRVAQSDPLLEQLVMLADSATQIDLSHDTGYPQSSISAFRLGVRQNVRFTFARDLANHFGYDLVLVKRRQ